MIKIRLSRYGAKKKPFYKVTVSDVRSPRNGKFIERVGYFNPIASKNEIKIKIKLDRVKYWINKGAKASNRVRVLLKKLNK